MRRSTCVTWACSALASCSIVLFAGPSWSQSSSSIAGGCRGFTAAEIPLPIEYRDQSPARILAQCSTSPNEASTLIGAVGFDGPPRGFIATRSQNGTWSTPVPIGRPVAISLIPVGRSLLLTVEATLGFGTGVREDQLSLFLVADGLLRKLWEAPGYRHEDSGTKDGSGPAIRRTALGLSDGGDGTVVLDYVVFSESGRTTNATSRAPKLLSRKREILRIQ